MSPQELDISGWLAREDDLPRPRWDAIVASIEARTDPQFARNAWFSVGRQWLAALGLALGREYRADESEHFLMLASPQDATVASLLRFAEKCRATLLAVLDGVADFEIEGKQVVVGLRDYQDYYRYIAPFYPEGEHGGSAGVHIREGYPHVALCGKNVAILENTLAHELTHVSLHHLSMPQWLEEGLAQMFEHNMTGRMLLEVDGEMAGRHKRYWGEHGLNEFWRGEGFSRSGKVQELCYQLAEILVRLLAEDSQPRWFGWAKEPQRRFFAFLREARAPDCGQEACRNQLGCGLDALAARFLGPGSWAPTL